MLNDREINKKLLKEYYRGNSKIKDNIMIYNSNLVTNVLINEYSDSKVPIINLLKISFYGFSEAIDQYNLEKNGDFEVFVTSYISNYVKMSLTNNKTR